MQTELGLLVLGTIYFFPTVLAICRLHPRFPIIFLLNLFLGWTPIGWVGAVAWACGDVERRSLHG